MSTKNQSNYRGFVIRKDGETTFAVLRFGSLVTRCGTYYSAVAYIDELLSVAA